MRTLCQQAITQEDIQITKKLKDLELKFFYNDTTYLKIYSKTRYSISTFVRLLSDFGIETLEDISYEIEDVYVNQLTIQTETQLLQNAENIVTTIMKKALLGETFGHCKLYRLAVSQRFTMDKILFLRAMIKYLDQLLIEKREESIIKTFLQHGEPIALITNRFFAKKGIRHIDRSIEESFKSIKNFEEDKLLRIFYAVVQNITATNFFKSKEAKSFKIEVENFKHLLPSLQPNIEMFVYHPRFLGVHLRVSKVSRGGIRWSEREDFREEIKSLMITQEAKNAIIVPSGGKGGLFIEKRVSKEEFTNYYSMYIDALLDLIDKKPVDGGDFYFVVAADKGTSDMSDVANEIALKRGFWLKDAFASGGKYGYNHKKLGVTANGAWISAARHFIDKGIDIFNDSISVVGTGSMRGDVFGNGMLINPNIRLIGAISSHEIFIDPDPDPKIAYEERKRLFEESKSWSSYDPKKISEGGDVFSRYDKEIQLSAQIKKLLGIKKNRISGEELAKRLLCAKVDLLYIGGIGTYVKSSEELNIYIADKINEPVRVDASDLRAYAVCEGGNLGFTQKARIEYAKNGGKINLDSIDNSAGVDTSDHEVNLKIVLNQAMESGKIDFDKRNEVLKSVTKEVLQKVFETNHHQPLAITLDAIRSKTMLEEIMKVIEILEREVEFFKRRDFEIPKNKDFSEVIGQEGKVVRPVLGILLSFSKIFLKTFILESGLCSNPFFEHYLYKYFPKSLYPLFEQEVLKQPLREHIIATVAANIIIDNAGVTFLADFDEIGKERFAIKVKSYLLLYSLLSIAKVKKEYYDKELQLKHNLYPILLEIEHSIEFSLKWIVRNYHQINLEPFHILSYKNEIAQFLSLEKGRSENFFKYIDLIKFIMLAIHIKELKEYTLSEILQLLMLIISTFKIDELLQLLGKFVPKDAIGKEIQSQLIELLNYFVTVVAKDVVLYTRATETLEDGLKHYMEEKMINPNHFYMMIEEMKANASSDLMRLICILHKLLLEAV
ncbi:NAD-glutamate dehydrogenase domain-containing protein [Nitratiruptor sp. SB155-2]|uniref:NAD-glutamate dehydrogenase domain-containing protein n=1 Tax=Nitratiruptor sp. (strain SB155-2) TaxID=387092 RepID=UPI000158736C|nr:NAD-glutamate dehydrogenase domain-containing protein [Nitratiruptor sp. SB155-2]BAF70740.1 conserved hypothetical protein [Nitratiruptor sp. SB155-2]